MGLSGSRPSQGRGLTTTLTVNIQGCSAKAPTGTSPEAAIRRLSKDAEAGNAKAADLLDRVTSGEIKPHAAAVAYLWRVQVRIWTIRWLRVKLAWLRLRHRWRARGCSV